MKLQVGDICKLKASPDNFFLLEVLLPPRTSTENGVEVAVWNDNWGYCGFPVDKLELVQREKVFQ